jgi:hypothetical protein
MLYIIIVSITTLQLRSTNGGRKSMSVLGKFACTFFKFCPSTHGRFFTLATQPDNILFSSSKYVFLFKTCHLLWGCLTRHVLKRKIYLALQKIIHLWWPELFAMVPPRTVINYSISYSVVTRNEMLSYWGARAERLPKGGARIKKLSFSLPFILPYVLDRALDGMWFFSSYTANLTQMGLQTYISLQTNQIMYTMLLSE